MAAESWQGHDINHRDFGRGRVLTDLADRDAHQEGRMLVQFANATSTRRWVDARNCELV